LPEFYYGNAKNAKSLPPGLRGDAFSTAIGLEVPGHSVAGILDRHFRITYNGGDNSEASDSITRLYCRDRDRDRDRDKDRDRDREKARKRESEKAEILHSLFFILHSSFSILHLPFFILYS
jgi:hypothetical protein